MDETGTNDRVGASIAPEHPKKESTPASDGATATASSMHDDHPPCPNCNTPRFGPFCYRCGQPEKGLIRQFSSIAGDFLDTVFNFDSRTIRTLVPLYARPGFLTLEYFAGRRQRFVTPIRLFFFLSVIAFLVVQWSTDTTNAVNFDDSGQISKAKTLKEVDAALAAQVKKLEKTFKATQSAVPSVAREDFAKGMNEGLAEARVEFDKAAAERKAWIMQRDAAIAAGKDPPTDPSNKLTLRFNDSGEEFDEKNNPVRVPFLTDAMNRELTKRLAHSKEVLSDPARGPKVLVQGLFEVLPQTLFVLMPLFALLLKVVYLFKRRLYMEHLMVALHSHAFIFLSIILIVLFNQLTDWAKWDNALTGLIAFVLGAWIPLYLFIMQKRVYGQGWIMTTIKFAFTGFCYTIMASFALVGALLFSLLTLG